MGRIINQLKQIKLLQTIRQFLFNPYSRYVWLLSHLGRKVNGNKDNKRCELYVITIAYNHKRLIERQIEFVRRYIKDEDYQHIIVDNSPKRDVRQQIKGVCEREKIEYVPVPTLIDKLICHRLFNDGLSHGAALNWMFYHFLKQRRPVRFALIDHDVFPMKDFSFIDKLGERDFYGVDRIRERGWYLWPGWCVFRYDAIVDRHPNFLPVNLGDVYLDAGGGNYLQIYCHYNVEEMDFPDVDTMRVKHTKGLTAYNDIYHGDCIQYIDHAWLHLINGSNYAKIPGKEEYINEMIEGLEEIGLH